MIARRIGQADLVPAAAPDYLARRPAPQSPEDLKAHHCILDVAPQRETRWQFPSAKGAHLISVTGPVKVNDGETAASFAAAGFGIARLPRMFVQDHLNAVTLVEVLPDHRPDPAGIYAVFPPSRFQTRSVRALIDTLTGRSNLP